MADAKITALANLATTDDTDLLVTVDDVAGTPITKKITRLNLIGSASLLPATTDAAALGSTGNQWSDLFLAEGGVINWDNGDVSITQTGNVLAFAGASSGYRFDNGIVGSNGADYIDIHPNTTATCGYARLELADNPFTTNLGETAWNIIGEADVTSRYFAALTRFSGFDGTSYYGYYQVGAEGTLQSDGTKTDYAFFVHDLVNSVDLIAVYSANPTNINIGGNLILTGYINTGTVYGGYAVGSTLTLQSTSAAGTTDAIYLKVGNNGAVTGLRVDHSGTVGFGNDLYPITSGVGNIGGASNQFANLYLSEGAAINWDNGDATLTQSGNTVTLAGAALSVPDDAYGVGWNGSTEVPTKNALYDKIETLGGSGATTALDNLASVAINAALVLGTSDAFALGSVTKQWSDLFLAEGAVINWDNGDATLTQVGNVVTLAGADLVVDNITINTSLLPDANDGAALGTTALQFSDLFLAEGAVINFDNGDATITQVGDVVTVAGADLKVTTAGNVSTSVLTTDATQTLTNKTLTSPTLTTPSAFTTGGTITLAENTSIALDPAGSADGKYTGITVTATSGYTQAFGDLVYLDPTDSRWGATDANSASGADGDARGILGMVVSTGTDGNACTILLQGIIRADAKFPTFTVNNPIYVSETAGLVTQTQPTTADVVIRIVGAALTADEMYFNPDNVWITHA